MKYELYYSFDNNNLVSIKSWFMSINPDINSDRLFLFNGRPKSGYPLSFLRYVVKYTKNKPELYGPGTHNITLFN